VRLDAQRLEAALGETSLVGREITAIELECSTQGPNELIAVGGPEARGGDGVRAAATWPRAE
jgi:hypothetical protein